MTSLYRWRANKNDLISNNLGGEVSMIPSLQPHSLVSKEYVLCIQTTEPKVSAADVFHNKLFIVLYSGTPPSGLLGTS